MRKGTTRKPRMREIRRKIVGKVDIVRREIGINLRKINYKARWSKDSHNINKTTNKEVTNKVRTKIRSRKRIKSYSIKTVQTRVNFLA